MPTESALERILSFANTLDVEDGVDHLDSPEGLVQWLRENDLFPADGTVEAGAVDSGAVSLARQARDGIRALIHATHHADLDDGTVRALDGLDDVVAAARLHPRFSAGAVDLEPGVHGVPGALGRLLSGVHAAMADGSWQRLKLCASDDCRWAFVDQSRNRSGRWCDMAVCGNRAKVRAWRDRVDD